MENHPHEVSPTVDSVERSLQALALQPPGHVTIPADLPPIETAADSIPLAALPRFVELICGYPPEAELAPVLYGVTMVRKLLSVEESPPIDAVIATGVCPHLIALLQLRDTHSQLHYESAWALSNILSGSTQDVSYLVSIGVVPALLNLLHSPHDECRGQAAWGLGNIAGDCVEARDYLVGQGVLDWLQQALCDTRNSASTVGNLIWALLNVIRAKPYLPLNRVVSVGPIALGLLSTRKEPTVRADSAWILAELTSIPGGVEMVLEQGGLPVAVAVLQVETSVEILAPTLTWFGNMTATSNPMITPMCVNSGCVMYIARILALPINGPGVRIIKLAYWVLSNLASDGGVAVQGIVEAGIVPTIFQACSGPLFPAEIRKEAGWTFANLLVGADVNQARYLVDCGALSVFSNLWPAVPAELIVASLNGLDNLLTKGAELERQLGLNCNPFAAAFEECEGIDALERLQEHVSEQVYQAAIKVIGTHFDVPE